MTGTLVAGRAVVVIELFTRFQLGVVMHIDSVASCQYQHKHNTCQSLPQRRVPFCQSRIVSG